MQNRILVLGVNGMLGGSLFRQFTKNKKLETVGTIRQKNISDWYKYHEFNNIICSVNADDDCAIAELIKEVKPNWVFNCIGIIKQFAQDRSQVSSIYTNSLLPHKVAEICDDVGARLVHFSTDCVFSGSKGGYSEKDVPDAFDIYGRSKLLGEIDYGQHITFRTSIVGHEINSSVSLVSWFLNQTEKVRGFSGAKFSGLPTVSVAEFIEKYVLNSAVPGGLYHLSVDSIDKCSLLEEIRRQYGLDIEIEKYREFKIDRSLDSSVLQNLTGYKPPLWTDLVGKMFEEYKEYFLVYDNKNKSS